MLKTAVFTIVSNNYWAFARTLMQSLAVAQPDWERHVLLVDRSLQPPLPDDGIFTTTTVEELALPDSKSFLFRYTVLELNTAVKPWMFGHLRQQGYQRIIYLDPDILVLRPLVEIERLLQEGATAVVTPHLTAPLMDDRRPTELDIMRSGTYNLGFLALGNTPQSDQLIAWWQQKLLYDCVVDLPRGLFTDQKWIDLAPGMFDGVSILRDPGYNVAYWNLAHRPVTRDGEEWLSGGRPLCFFHFSGFNPEQPGPFSKHQDRFDLKSLGECKELAVHYANLLLGNGYGTFKNHSYAFGCFEDGTPIPDAIRVAYREYPKLQRQAGDNPFAAIGFFAEVPRSGLPPLLQGLLRIRKDISGGYVPEMAGEADRQALMAWFLHDRCTQHGIPERFILPIRNAVSSPDDPAKLSKESLLRHTSPSLGGMLESLHHRITGKPPSYQRLQQYRSIRSVSQFLALGGRQFKRYFRGVDAGQPVLPAFRFSASLPAGTASRARLLRPEQGSEVVPPPGVNLVGYARSEHGVGQSLRLCSTALQAVAHPHLLIDFTIGNLARTNDTSQEHLLAEEPRYPVNIFHVNADQMPVVFQSLPPDFFNGRYNIGFWHWELTELPDAFLEGFNGLDEVWVPTGFVHDAVSRKSPLPVVKIPHAIQFAITPCCRADFDLPEQRFLFLSMYDFSSYQERKNPKGALDAFDRAFGRTDNRVALVIKTQNSHLYPQAREELQTWLETRKNVVWLDRTLTRQEVYNLESLCDCFLSLHRSEGFGLGPAESMYLGKPVIATNWSGTTEFMRQDNSLPVNYQLVTIAADIGVYEKGQQWAEPDIEHAAQLMRQVVDDPELCSRIGHAAQKSIMTELSPFRIGRMQQQRLGFIQGCLL